MTFLKCPLLAQEVNSTGTDQLGGISFAFTTLLSNKPVPCLSAVNENICSVTSASQSLFSPRPQYTLPSQPGALKAPDNDLILPRIPCFLARLSSFLQVKTCLAHTPSQGGPTLTQDNGIEVSVTCPIHGRNGTKLCQKGSPWAIFVSPAHSSACLCLVLHKYLQQGQGQKTSSGKNRNLTSLFLLE